MKTIQTAFLAKSYIAKINTPEHSQHTIDFISMATGRIEFTVDIDGHDDYDSLKKETTYNYYGETEVLYQKGLYQRYEANDSLEWLRGYIIKDGKHLNRQDKRSWKGYYARSVKCVGERKETLLDGVESIVYVWKIEAQRAEKKTEFVWKPEEDEFYNAFKKEWGIELPPEKRMEGGAKMLTSTIANKLGINIINII